MPCTAGLSQLQVNGLRPWCSRTVQFVRYCFLTCGGNRDICVSELPPQIQPRYKSSELKGQRLTVHWKIRWFGVVLLQASGRLTGEGKQDTRNTPPQHRPRPPLGGRLAFIFLCMGECDYPD